MIRKGEFVKNANVRGKVWGGGGRFSKIVMRSSWVNQHLGRKREQLR